MHAPIAPDSIVHGLFWDAALKTGRTIHIGHNGKDYEVGVIPDPQALIKALQSK
jgi:hypothetical protein